MKLSGDRCQCPACKEYFNSVYAYELHRIGPIARMNDTSIRRCLTVAEMQGRGMGKNAQGFWISQAMPVFRAAWRNGAKTRGGSSNEGEPTQGAE